jgi:hypothetical protein
MPFVDRKEDKKGSLASMGKKKDEGRRRLDVRFLTRLSMTEVVVWQEKEMHNWWTKVGSFWKRCLW